MYNVLYNICKIFLCSIYYYNYTIRLNKITIYYILVNCEELKFNWKSTLKALQ